MVLEKLNLLRRWANSTFPAPGPAPGPAPDPAAVCNGTIEVTGSGEVEVAPDQAVVALTVMTQAKTAAAAAAANTERIQAVIAAVEAEPNTGVTTTGLGVSPITSYDPETNINRIIGYRATNGVDVETRPEYAGRIYDAGVEAGANQSSGISFRIADEGPYREAALRIAVGRACATAKVVAESAAIGLAGAESIEIDPGPSPAVYRAAALEVDAPPSLVLPDDVTIAAIVRVVFRTKI